MNGLAGINIELTSRCNKECWCCGRRKMEKEHPELCDWGDMEVETAVKIANEIPEGVFIQFHWNGEPLLYPYLATALSLFRGHYMGLDTNGKLLIQQKNAICLYLNSITISIIQDDAEGMQQLNSILNFLEINARPLTVFRILGDIDEERQGIIDRIRDIYGKLIICHRVLHQPEGSFGYEKPVTIPEIGVCLEMLHKLAIDRYGNVFPCVRYDPHKRNLLGNVNDCSLFDIWYGEKRRTWLKWHIEGRRDLVPLCRTCEFWGIPRG